MNRSTQALAVLLIAACGGGSGDDDAVDGAPGGADALAEIDPSVMTVDPPSGPLAGGNALTITGMDLEGNDAVFVLVGDRLATDVSVGPDGAVTATTPPGADVATVDVVLFNSSGFARATGAYAYNAVPTITSVGPSLPTEGGPITIVGTGFVAGLAGDNTITVAGVPCAAATTVSDTQIDCTAPASTTFSRALVVTNRNGSATGRVAYGPPDLYAFDGRAGVAGSAYTVSIVDAVATPIATLTVPLTGATITPDGRMLGFEAVGRDGGDAHLWELDLAFGLIDLGILVGHPNVPDATLAGGEIYAWTESDDQLTRIDPATALVTPIPGSINSAGSGLAGFSDGKLFFVPQAVTGDAYLIDPVAGTQTRLGNLTSAVATGAVCALTFHRGVLYGVVKGPDAVTAGSLVTIDPATLIVTTIGALPLGIDAIASAVPEPPVSPPPPVVVPDPVDRAAPLPVLPALELVGPEGRLRLEAADLASSPRRIELANRGRRGSRLAARLAGRVSVTTCAGRTQALRAPAGGSLATLPNQQGAWKIVADDAAGVRTTLARGICRVTEAE